MIDITKMSIQELKALAYDNLAQQQVISQSLKVINAEIAKRIEEEKVAKPKVKK